jgi:hypothetical protein
MESLQKFAAAESIFAAQFTAIGAFSGLVLQYFNWEKELFLHAGTRPGGGRIAHRRRGAGAFRLTFAAHSSRNRQA